MSGDDFESKEILVDLKKDSETHTQQLEQMDGKIDKVAEQNLNDKLDRAIERAADKAEGVAQAAVLLEKAADKATALLEKAATKAAALLKKGRGQR